MDDVDTQLGRHRSLTLWAEQLSTDAARAEDLISGEDALAGLAAAWTDLL